MRTPDRRPGPSLAVSPLVVVGVALAWLVGLAAAGGPLGALLLVLVAGLTAWFLGAVPPADFLRRGAVPFGAAAGIFLANLVLSAHNADPAAVEWLRLGPLRLTGPARDGALILGTRVLAIVASGLAMTSLVEPTRLADALVHQAGVPARFAYGALAAYQAVPRLAADLAVLRAVRRARGLSPAWHPGLLVGLLVRAVRHADQLALAMDARGFESGPRTTFRPIHWGPADVVVAAAGLAALVVAIALGR